MRCIRHLFWPSILGLGLWGALALQWEAASAQQPVLQPRRINIQGFDPPPETAPAFITNREMSRRLRTAKDLFAEKDYRTGVRYVQSILDEKVDWFLDQSPQQKPAVGIDPPEERQFHFASLKHEAERLIAALPEAGRKVYEEEVGINAGILLKKAVATNDQAELSQIARRYFHTQAGYEAVYRLGLLKADHGEPFAAALHFSRLKSLPQVAERFEPMLSLKLALCWEQAGLHKQSLSALHQLKQNSPNGRIRVGRQEIPLFDRGEDPGRWLAKTLGQSQNASEWQSDQWPVFRGNASRNATSTLASPIGPVAWSKNTLREEDAFGPSRGQMKRLEKTLSELAEDHQRNKHLLPVPAAQPLIVGDKGIFRTLRNVQAVDLRSGEVLWKTRSSDEMLRPVLAHASGRSQAANAMNRGQFQNPNRGPQYVAIETYLTQRKWRDMTWGTLSSDPQRVYSIEEVGLADGMYLALGNENDPFMPSLHNKLVAFELQSGFADWEAGGPLTNGNDPVAGTFFLGPPLPLGEQLFCLGERKNEISLMVLDATTGELVWEQRLVSPPMSLSTNRERRTQGLTPAFGHGVMICPTSTGAVVAVDISRRMLLWAYQYESTMTDDTMRSNPIQIGRNVQFPLESIYPENHWADSVPIVADGRVLVTPMDSYELHCLELSTGERQWSIPREQGIYLAGVWDGMALVVSRSQVRALQLSDGREAWNRPVSISLPAGRGFFAGNRYHLPLSTGEMATIDLEKGRMVARTKLPGEQQVGNLVSAGGRVVFQSLETVGAFQPWDQLNTELQHQLKTDPDHPEALALRGRLRLHSGEEAEALADLQKAYAADPTEDTRSLLVDLLLEGLRNKPTEYSKHRDNLRKLLRSSEESLRFLMLTEVHTDSAESRAKAFQDYLGVAKSLDEDLELQQLAEGHHVRTDRWVKARFEELAAAATPKELQEWNRLVSERLTKSLPGKDPEAQLRILACLPRLPAVASAELASLRALGKTQNPLEQTFRLKQIAQSQEPELRNKANIALAELYLEWWREEDAAQIIQSLGKAWPGQWQEQFKDLGSAKLEWPNRKLEATFFQRNEAVLPELPVQIVKNQDSRFGNWTFAINQQTRKLLARDENGRDHWYWDLGELTANLRDYSEAEIAFHGHLAVLAFKTHFVVLDLLKREHTATLRWWKPLVDEELDEEELFQMQRFGANPFNAPALPPRRDLFGDVLLVNQDAIIYQLGPRLIAVDPLTGAPQWTREDLRPRCRLLGNDGHVVVIPPGGKSAFVHRVTDGEMIRNVPLPDAKNQIAFHGENLITLKGENLSRELECRSLVNDEVLWRMPCLEGTELQKIGRNELALLANEGTLRIVSLSNGKRKIQAKIDPDPKRQSFYVFRLASCYVLLTNRGEDDTVAGQDRFLHENAFLSVNGPVYAFHPQTGKPLWKTQVDDQALEHLPSYNSPVVVFNKYRPPGRVIGDFGRNNYLVRILDLRNGQMIFQHNRLEGVSPWRMQIQPTRQIVTIRFFQGVIEVELTKDPLGTS